MVQTGWRANRHPTAVVPLGVNSDGSFVPAGDSSLGTATWVLPAAVTTNAAAATDILAAGLAGRKLVVFNSHESESARIAFDGSDASSTHGLPIAAGRWISFDFAEVPDGKISAYTTNAGQVGVAYIA
jgi:hypothetical protein